MSRTLSTTVGVVAGAAITGAGLYWLYRRLTGGKGGPGIGLGGGGGGSDLLGDPASGPSDTPGPGGSSLEEGEGQGDNADGQGQGGNGKNTGGRPGARPGSGSGKKPSGTGPGGQTQGGGKGGGTGGGVGAGEGPGMSDDTGEGGSGDSEEGGGEGEQVEYAGWGDLMITADLDPPDISPEKLAALRDTVHALVNNTVFETDLPPPLDVFNPEYGTVLVFWADVALHSHHDLPWGRLDPDNATHEPWIALWIDILEEVIVAENLLNLEANDELDDPGFNASAGPQTAVYGQGRRAPAFARRLDRLARVRPRRRSQTPGLRLSGARG